jgi:putative DNA primase/helicase
MVPQMVLQANTKYRETQNLVGSFSGGPYRKGELESVPAAVLFQSFKNWASDNSEFLLGNTKFGVEAKKLLSHKVTNAGTVYLGMRVKDAVPIPAPTPDAIADADVGF